MPVRQHYLTLDGLRGLVAISVLFFHIVWQNGLGSLSPHGYLGVDFFFCLERASLLQSPMMPDCNKEWGSSNL